jgi:hypothetical protein
MNQQTHDQLLWDQVKRFNDYCLDPEDWYQTYGDEYDDWFLEKREFKEEHFSSAIQGGEALEERLLISRLEKRAIELIQQRLNDDITYNQVFKEKVDWPVLQKLLMMSRLKELTLVKIVKRGGRGKGLRYDATDLSRTFFGKRIFKSLDMGRRRILEAGELDQVRAACAKLKLDLPEEIEPTTTELYFAEDSQ